jgi:DNA-binding GntR family transcriptional regulator
MESDMAGDTEAVQAYRQLRDLIIRTELRPGAALVEADLMERLGVGRTPLRDALHHLDHEGLVEILPRRGTFVTEVTLSDLQQVFEVRSGLEDIVARLAVDRCTADDLAEVAGLVARVERNHSNDESDVELDAELHRLLLQIGRNPLLETLYRRVSDASLRLLYLTNCGMEDRLEQIATFQAIHDTLAARDADALADVLRGHVRSFRDRVSHSIFSTADLMMT